MVETWKILTSTIEQLNELLECNNINKDELEICIDDLRMVQRDLAVAILECLEEKED